jgi:predicted DCC family thiol-disulfide oxidoreductase YuxK
LGDEISPNVDNSPMESRRDHAILYDDDCGFCKLSVRGLMRLDRDERLRPVAIQSAEGERLLTEIPAEKRLESAHLVTPGGTVLSGGDAAVTLARLLPAGEVPARLFRRFPDATDRTYRWVARNRSTFGRLGLRSRKPLG